MTFYTSRIAISVALFIGTGGTPVSAEFSDAEKLVAQKGAEEDFEAMINGLVNRNREPKIVDFENGEVPIFSDDYDWAEYDRISKLRARLFKNENTRLWEYLVKHMDDDRYALTVGDDDPGNAVNLSVGDICSEAARARLDFAIVHMKVENGERADRLWLDLGTADLPAWRKERAQKSLYELQVELAEAAIQKIQQDADLTNEAKKRIERDLRSKLKVLSQMTTPLFFAVPVEQHGLFNAKKAATLRRRLETAKKK